MFFLIKIVLHGNSAKNLTVNPQLLLVMLHSWGYWCREGRWVRVAVASCIKPNLYQTIENLSFLGIILFSQLYDPIRRRRAGRYSQWESSDFDFVISHFSRRKIFFAASLRKTCFVGHKFWERKILETRTLMFDFFTDNWFMVTAAIS